MMTSVKSKTDNVKEPTNSNRRSFLWKAGAAMSVGLATAVQGMATTSNDGKNLKLRLNKLENENAIRDLHRTYENLLDGGEYYAVTALFSNNAEVIFNGGIYKGKGTGISRLYSEHFKTSMTGRKMQPAPGFQADEQPRDTIEIAEDGLSARARFPYSIQVGAPIQDDSVLVQMARLHGEGIRKWWEGGIYEITYIKDTKEGIWKIARIEHRVLARADYKPGSSHAKPISVPPFNKVYPEEPTGPDQLIIST